MPITHTAVLERSAGTEQPLLDVIAPLINHFTRHLCNYGNDGQSGVSFLPFHIHLTTRRQQQQHQQQLQYDEKKISLPLTCDPTRFRINSWHQKRYEDESTNKRRLVASLRRLVCANRLRLLARHHIDDDEDNNTIHESENEDDDDDGDKNEAAHGDVALRFVADLIESELLTTTASEAGDFDNDDDDNNDDETNDEHAMIAACCCNDNNNNDATSASSGATNLTAAVAVAVDDFSSCLSNAICVESALQVATAAEAYDSFAECLVAQLFDESRREAQDAQRERATQSPQLPPIAASVSTSSNRSGRRHSSIDMSSSSYQYNPHTLNGPRRRAPLMEEETATATALNNARRHSDIQQQQHDEWWKKRTTTNSSAVAAAASSSSSGSSNSCSQHNRIVFKQEQAKRPRVNFVHHLVCVGDCGNSSGNECNNVLDADIASSSSSSSTSTAIVPYAKVTLRKVSENAPMATKRATAAAVPAVSAFADDMMSMVMSESMRCAVDVSARVAQSPFVSQLSESLWSEALEMVSAVQLLNKNVEHIYFTCECECKNDETMDIGCIASLLCTILALCECHFANRVTFVV